MRYSSLKKSLIGLLLLTIAGTGAFTGCSRQSHPSFSWYDRLYVRGAFYYYLHQDEVEIEKESLSGESGVYYFTSYYLNGMLSAAEATQSDWLLKKTVHYMDNMLRTAQTIDYKGKPYKACGPFVISPFSDVTKPNVHFTLQATVPFARAAAIIRNNPRWRSTYDNTAHRYIEFADSAVIQYWYITQYNRHVPWLDVEHVPIWNDNSTNMGLVATYLYAATGNDVDKEVALGVGQAFQAKLSPWNRGWIWESHTIPIGSDTDNTPGSVGNQAGVPDTSHTNREPFLMIALHETGLMYQRDDITRMANTFIDSIWNQSYENPSFANYLNGSNKPYRVYKEPGLNGPIYHGWAFVGGYSPEAQKVLLATVKAIVHGKTNPSLVRNSTSYGGMVGLTGQMLRNFMVLSAEPSKN